MSYLKKIKNKIYSIERLKSDTNTWKKAKEKIAFTNGCFDIIHKGHIKMLAHVADLGDKLIIGLNSDLSIQTLKGANRPIIHEDSRAFLLASLSFVDAVILFSEETPINLINTLNPDILAKGGDYKVENIVGNKIVQQNGGQVIIVPFIDGFSSSKIIKKIKHS